MAYLRYLPKLGSIEEKLLFEQSNTARFDEVRGIGIVP
jgi:hypothetical protein